MTDSDEGARIKIFSCAEIWWELGLTAQAIATTQGQVIERGDLNDLIEPFPRAEVMELPGAVVVPGLHDAHAHPGLVGVRGESCDVSPAEVQSNHEILAMIQERASGGGDAWVVASGYDANAMSEGVRLTREALDAIAPTTPVVIFDRSCHWGVLNSVALERASIDDGSTPPPGGGYGRTTEGTLDGSVWERAFFEIAYDSVAGSLTPIPKPSGGDVARGVGRVLSELSAAGYTAVTDALVGPTEVSAYLDLERRGELPMSVSLLAAVESFDATRALLSEASPSSLHLAGVKLFVDGAVSGGTCLLREPLEGHRPFAYYTQAELQEVVGDVHHAGQRVAAHANGDEAIDRLLTVLETLGPDVQKRRHRIEHCSIVDQTLVSRMAALGIVAVPFGNYATFHGQKLLEWYGDERAQRMFAHRWLRDAGVNVAGSSDYPCGPFDFSIALESCVAREKDGMAFGQSQAITAEEVLHIYTAGSAYAAGLDLEMGRLAPGMVADFTVLDRNPMRTHASEIAEIQVLATYSGGELVDIS